MDKIQEELKRYNMMIDQDAISVEEVWCEHGGYVKFSDIKNILESQQAKIKRLKTLLHDIPYASNLEIMRTWIADTLTEIDNG